MRSRRARKPSLPLVDLRLCDALEIRDARVRGAARTNRVTTRIQTLHVLVVDDDVHVLGFVAETLQADGYEVQTALDGQHALQKITLNNRPYDLIIVDARMPHLDGWRFIVQARAGGYKGKIIVFSAHLDEHELQRYRHLEVDRIIKKPPKAGELIEAVREIAGARAP